MSTVTSADGTPIDYNVYGSGPAVILIGGTTQHRAIDRRTTGIAQRLGGEGFAAVDYDRRGRGRSGDTAPWSLDREVEDVDALIEATGDPRPSTPAPLAQPSRSPLSPPASQSRRSPSTSRPTSPVLMAASTSPHSSECWTRASTTEPAATT
jgi:hypothetical protein